MTTENFESIKKYIADEIMKFQPEPTKGDKLHQLEIFIDTLINDSFQGILCLYTRAKYLKDQTLEFERVIRELKGKIPELII